MTTESAASVEIEIEVEVEHPAERVWRALTEERLLRQWFADTDLKPRVGAFFQFSGTDLPGLQPDPAAELPDEGSVVEGEVVGVETGERIVLFLHGPGLVSRFRWEIAPVDGHRTRVVLHQSWREGAGSDAELAEKRAAYETALGTPLAAVLDWLAFGEVDLESMRGRRGPETVIIPRLSVAGLRSARTPLIIAGVVVLIGLIAVTGGILWGRNADGDDLAADPGVPTVTSSASAGATEDPLASSTSMTLPSAGAEAPSAGATTKPPSLPPPSANTPAAPPSPGTVDALTAAYKTDADWAFGYRGKIDLANPGTVENGAWTVVITLKNPIAVTKVTGAKFTQSGETVTFTPEAGVLPVGAGGGTASFTFEADLKGSIFSDREPTACTINGRACSGV
ncbi:cellulose binding domain-containing protein [Catenuloplanes japonicus]|uniref:cellulose binding domain-containing protein n=1 Tax=Catenuloplanes japonicus TaxID=33876 RepID=UPI000525E3C9|nr:cellulose binding domain-containing protein [Catenuloplanes japonicus]